MLRHGLTILLAGALIGAPVVALAQTPAAPDSPTVQGLSSLPFRVLDQERLLRESRMGQQILAGIDAERQALEAENQTLFDQLSAEERALTDARPTLTPEDFRARADAFNTRVETIRSERAQRAQELAQHQQAAEQRFFDAVLPVLARFMADEGVAALLRPEALLVRADAMDITDEMIARLDATMPEGPQPAATGDGTAPAPDTPAPDTPAPDTPSPPQD
ncbi:MAG: OmpH family outer membrane protein [Rhodobacter sp.]|uniref:OmpH family outer membrane protein n=1 Tax=Pararhodobacter sp. TaxID=2127056 RepID=UPI001E0345F6|nr:OmpH family outer membrane protein [Pararhodobacter sp.]MCB1346472.1 OmpH family outer membrane protein [Paracoccaceae bacterium]MCC0073669.1 OmpH family outer membrane protein [Rhodobacter sp.]HPD92254.1 OmpH family outer membrane protein [Pararhodobacter sp.]